ncbi:MAG: ribbon-helix-helix protein, CopG family [Actinomycetota bacterium]
MKTMAIRLEDDTSAQLTVLAQLEGTSVADLIRQAIERLIADKRSETGLAGRAQAVLADIDREALARKAAIETLFGSPQAAPEEAPAPSPSRRGGKRSPSD